MTDQQLQLALTKMLPEKICWNYTFQAWTWMNSTSPLPDVPVLDTEWLHVCWLVEQTISDDLYVSFIRHLASITCGTQQWYDFPQDFRRVSSASWQQRAEALCKVKGITP